MRDSFLAPLFRPSAMIRNCAKPALVPRTSEDHGASPVTVRAHLRLDRRSQPLNPLISNLTLTLARCREAM
ncbi:MAG: hypothetical protein LAN83_02875 [Acidobacteriia bacterium]|nr:hypothetical protein [Terriglobia bacterium]